MNKKNLFPFGSLFLCFTPAYAGRSAEDIASCEWTLIDDEAQWTPRAGMAGEQCAYEITL